MKILHTSDWHLGRQFHGVSMETDHAAILGQVMDAILGRAPDVLIIAGDIFDRASPPADAIRQFNGFIERVHRETQAAIVLIAGNHDSGDRIGSLAALANRNRVLIRGPLIREEAPLLLADEHGPVAISALPFGNEYVARACFEDAAIACPADLVSAQVAAARRHLPQGARWVVVAHAFISSGVASESERKLIVGGIETVPPSVFDGAHYVALGHLHRPQRAGGEHLRYSGSPLAFGFDEADAEKSMTLVTLGPDGVANLELLPFTPLRRVRVAVGAFDDLLAAATAAPSEDFIKLVLTDAGAIVDAIGRIREHYPNAVALSFARDEATGAGDEPLATPRSRLTNPMAVVEEFFLAVRPEGPLSDAEKAIVTDGFSKLANTEASV